MLVLPVVNEGVWQDAHPTEPNSAFPFVIDGAPPGVSADGTGGASVRMKNENFSIELIAPTGVVALVSITLLGWAANWHPALSSRSVWNISFVMPISTL